MSQVRKLLNGNKIIKAQQGYKFKLDSRDVYYTDEDLKEIDDKIAALPMEYRRFLGNATNAIKSGTQSGNRASNTVTLEQLSGLGDRDIERLRKQKGSYWETAMQFDSYHAKEAINAYLNILNTVANKPKSKESSTKKTFDKNKNIPLDFNENKDGKYSLSKTAGDNYAARSRIEAVLNYLNDPENSEYDLSNWDKLAGIRGWYDGLDGENKYQLANDYLNDLWTRMSTPGYEWGGDDEDFLGNFGIIRNSAESNGSEGKSNKDSAIYNEDGTIKPEAVTDTGAKIIVRGNPDKGEDRNGFYTNWNEVDTSKKPYLITELDWNKLGLNGEFEKYRHGLIYNKRLYTEDEINQYPGSDLYRLMQEIRDINTNSELTGLQRYEKLKERANWNGSENYGYYDYVPETYFINPYWRENLKGSNFSFFDASRTFGKPNGSIIGYYNYGDFSDLPFGFRTPKYLVYNGKEWTNDLNGLTPNIYAELSPFDSNKYIAATEGFGKDKKKYGVYKEITNTSTRLKTKVLFDIDNPNQLYVINGKKLIPVSEEFKKEIDKGTTDFTGAELVRGKINTAKGFLKDGGKVNYIAKLQIGRTIPAPIPLKETSSKTGTNMEPAYAIDSEGNLNWDSLPQADKDEIMAMFADLAGALGGWFGPWGSVGGAALGLGATGLNTAADIRRQRPWYGVVGSTVGNTLLDLASAVPELGEIAQVAKLTKTANRIAKSSKAISVIGGILNSVGAAQAIPVLHKVINGGFKDLTTDELYALSNGVRAASTALRGKIQHAGDSRLANEFSKAKSEIETNSGHTSTKALAKEVNVKFTNDDLLEIHNAGAEAGTVLRNQLIAKGADPSKLEVDDSALLTRFGFTVNKDTAGRITSVSSPEGYTLDTHTRSVGVKDAGSNKKVLLTKEEAKEILDGNEEAGTRLRRILTENHGVDGSKLNTDDTKLLREFGFGAIKNRSGKITHVRDESVVTDVWHKAVPKEEDYRKWGFLTDLVGGAQKRRAFIDESMKNDPVRTKIDELMSQTGENEPGRLIQKAYARSQFRIGESPKISKAGRLRPNIGSNSESNQGRNNPAPITQESAPIQNNPVPQANNPTPVPTNQSVPEVVKNSYQTPMVTNNVNLTERTNTRALQRVEARKQQRVAANIDKLKKSKDPMKTLSELKDSEKGLDQMVYDNPEAFQEALDYALRNMPLQHRSFNTPESRQRYIQGIKDFAETNNLMFPIVLKKKGGVLKGQNGFNPNWSAPKFPQWDFTMSPYKPKEYSLYPEGTGPTVGYNTTVSGVLGMSDFNPTGGRTTLDALLGKPYNKSNEDTGGGGNKNLSDKLNFVLPLISLGRYAYNARNINKFTDEMVAALNAGRYDLLPIRLNAPGMYDPYDRQLSQIRMERMAGMKPVTSDLIANNALWNQREGQLWNRENEVYGKQAAYQWDVQKETNNIQNQNIANWVQTANENAAKHAAINSAIKKLYANRTQMHGASGNNLGLEFENNVKTDLEYLNKYKEFAYDQQAQEAYDKWLDQQFVGERARYNALPWNEKSQYIDFEDYLERNSEKYGPLAAEIERRKKEMALGKLDWRRNNVLNYRYPNWLLGNSSTVGYKKGGYLRGSTRYTMEPDERIWVDNNKAAHKAIAKLNDNVIKLLLRALK